MKRLIDLASGETLIRGIDDALTFDDVLESEDSEYAWETDDAVAINGYQHWVDDLYLLDESVRFYKVLPEFEEEWFGYYDPEPLTMEEIRVYSTDSGEPLEKLMEQVTEI